MKLRNKLNKHEYAAILTTDHLASSYGQPVLVDARTSQAIDRFSAFLSEIVEVTEEEREALEAAGYIFIDG
jgi:hypothetical protein